VAQGYNVTRSILRVYRNLLLFKKQVKDISPELFEGEVMRIANNYLKYSGWLKEWVGWFESRKRWI